MTELCDLGRKWHTDKGPSENPLAHAYTPAYHQLLNARREEVKKVLEIGIGWAGLMHSDYRAGGSLFMWRDYFPNAEIYGLEIREDSLVYAERIHSYQCDQSSEDSLRLAAIWVGAELDLIVDDGSHVKEDQVLTARILKPLLAPNGIYVIEDVHDAELPWVLENLPFKCEVIEVENERLTGDRLIVIRG